MYSSTVNQLQSQGQYVITSTEEKAVKGDSMRITEPSIYAYQNQELSTFRHSRNHVFGSSKEIVVGGPSISEMRPLQISDKRRLPSPSTEEQDDYPLDLYMKRQRVNLMTSPDQALSKILDIKPPTNYDSILRSPFEAPLQVADVDGHSLSFNKPSGEKAPRGQSAQERKIMSKSMPRPAETISNVSKA